MSLAVKKLAESGIDLEQAGRLHMQPYDAEMVHLLHPSFHPVESLFIPYYDINGTNTTFYRLRYLGELPGWAGAVARPQRYVQEPHSLSRVYFPQVLPWREIAGDASKTIIITEGELKSAAACLRGFPTLGLGGVDNWRATKRGIDFLPDLATIKWTGRAVFIVYDSDAASNPNVCRASWQLAEVLAARGALPRIASLPAGPGGKKQGLDDYLLTASDEQFDALLQEAPLYGEGIPLWQMNEEVFLCLDPLVVIDRKTGRHMKPYEFVNVVCADRAYLEVRTDAEGNVKRTEKPLGPRWMKWPGRAVVSKLVYEPGVAPGLRDSGEWNTWPGWGAVPVEGDVEPWLKLLDSVFQGSPREHRDWFEKWCAFPLQNPGAKMYTSVLMWGSKHGTGKTLVGYTLANLYGKNATEIHDRDLRGNFNEWIVGKQFIVGDEVTGTESRAHADHIKGLITQSEVRVNRKYLPSYTVRDCANYFLTSNHPDALFLEDSDRRFFVHEVAPLELPPQEFYDAYDKWYRGEAGQGALMHYLLHFDLGDFNPRRKAPETEAREEMILASRTDAGSWVDELLRNPAKALEAFGPEVARECDLFRPEQLYAVYAASTSAPRSASTLFREFARRGMRVGPVWLGRPQRLHAVRNVAMWQRDRPAAAKHFLKFFPGE